MVVGQRSRVALRDGEPTGFGWCGPMDRNCIGHHHHHPVPLQSTGPSWPTMSSDATPHNWPTTASFQCSSYTLTNHHLNKWLLSFAPPPSNIAFPLHGQELLHGRGQMDGV